MIQGGNPRQPIRIGLGDGPKDTADATPQLARWAQGGIEVNFDHTPQMERHPSYNHSRIGWAARQALQWYPHSITDVPLYMLPAVYWAATYLGVDFMPLVTPYAYMLIYGAGFALSLYSYVGSHQDMGDTFTGDLVSKESLLKVLGPGWAGASADAVSRVATPFAVTPSGGSKARFTGRIAFGLGWRFAASIAATLAGTAMFVMNHDVFPMLEGRELTLTLFGWGANTAFPLLNSLLVGYGIHSHHGFRVNGRFRSGWKFFWDELRHPFTGAK